MLAEYQQGMNRVKLPELDKKVREVLNWTILRHSISDFSKCEVLNYTPGHSSIHQNPQKDQGQMDRCMCMCVPTYICVHAYIDRGTLRQLQMFNVYLWCNMYAYMCMVYISHTCAWKDRERETWMSFWDH